jgi:hypothetical protein
MSQKLTIVGAGWAGLSAAVHATRNGFQVHLFEAAATPGGRAKSISHQGLRFDNGQHAFLGAYSATLSLIESMGLSTEELFERQPLKWSYPEGRPYFLPQDPYPFKLARSVLWSERFDALEKLSLFKPALLWLKHVLMKPLFFSSSRPKEMSVAELFEGVSKKVIQDLISPLCLSAMNTPMAHASAQTFLQILRDAFEDVPHSCDFLWPKRPLSDLLPDRAVEWLKDHGARVQLGHRIDDLRETDSQVPCLLAVPPWQAAKLTQHINPHWSNLAHQLQHQAIASVYLKGEVDPLKINPKSQIDKRSSIGHLICFNQLLELENCVHPQFAVQHQATSAAHQALSSPTYASMPLSPLSPLSHSAPTEKDSGVEHWVLIVSVADPFKRDEIIQNAMALAQTELALIEPQLQFCSVEKRATFSCGPGLIRPPIEISKGLWACGDYIEGPYPSTIEGAVRSGVSAVERIKCQ